MGCVELVRDLFGALLIAWAKDVTGNFVGITLDMPFHGNPPNR
jgi:hypothetical protein